MSNAQDPCSHKIPGRSTPLAALGCTPEDVVILQMARHFFRSFAAPASHGWLTVFPMAEQNFAGRQPERIAVALLKAIQAMGRTRRSGFGFVSPDCPVCSRNVTEHERQFIAVLKEGRDGPTSALHVNAMLLCEGNETRPFITAMAELGALLDEGPLTGRSGTKKTGNLRVSRRLPLPGI